MTVQTADSDLHSSCPLMQVVYKDLNVSVKVKVKKEGYQTRQLLQGVSGILQPARLTAIMGASGAGKTTFLSVLAGIGLRGASVSSSIFVNGEKIEGDRMRRISGFVHQEDVILDTMTVREALTFAAFLRLPGGLPSAQKHDRALDVAEMLNLTKSLDNVVGSALIKGISGGEKRRLSLGMQMITNPSILFLDEPTSGLDTYTAHKVMSILSQVATVHGRTVIATIHQPSSDIFHLFNDMLVLADGRVMYHGNAEASVGYFADLGYVCPTYTNPSDYLFMSVLNTEGDDPVVPLLPAVVRASAEGKALAAKGRASAEGGAGASSNDSEEGHVAEGRTEEGISVRGARWREKEKERVEGLLQAWLDSKPNRAMMEELSGTTLNDKGISAAAVNSRAPWTTQMALLAARAARNSWRNKLILQGKLAQTIFLSLVVGLIYLNVDDDLRGVQDRQGALFFIIVQGVFGSIFGVLTVFGAEKGVFTREYSSRMYGLPVYFFSRWIVELPNHVIMPLLSSVIIYWMVGFQAGAARFLWFALTLILLDVCGANAGIFASCLFNNIEVAVAVMPMFVLPLMVFSGFFVNSANIPPYFKWISYISPMRYGFIATVKNEFTDLAINCTPKQKCDPGYSGEDVIRLMGFDNQGSIQENLAILFGLGLGFLMLAYIALWINVRKLSN